MADKVLANHVVQRLEITGIESVRELSHDLPVRFEFMCHFRFEFLSLRVHLRVGN